jgi:cytochrome c biogenesis protein
VANGRMQEQKNVGRDLNWIDGMWNWFVSMRTGLYLLGLIALLSVIGTLIPQEDLGPAANPIYKFLGFYDVYYTIWFRAVLGLLCINITLCSLQRFPVLWRNTFTVPSMPGKEALKHFPVSGKQKTSDSSAEAMGKVAETLTQQGFRTVGYREETGCLYADKGRFAPWGTLMVHLSLLVIVCGALLGNARGFSTTVSIPVGESYTVSRQQYPVGQTFSLRVNNFQTQYYSQGGVADWISDVSVVVNDQEIARKELKVNHPLDFAGVRIYQSSYGQAIKMHVYDHAGRIMQEESVPEGEFLYVAGESGMVVRLARYIPDFDPARPMVSRSQEPRNPRLLYIVYDKGKEANWGAAAPGETIKLGERGTAVFTAAIPYTGLQIKKDPGFPIVMAGFVLMTIGFFISLYTRYIQMWFAFSQQGTGTQVEWGGKTSRSQLEAENLQKVLAGVLPITGKE